MSETSSDPRDWAGRTVNRTDAREWARRRGEDMDDIDSLVRKGAGPTGAGGAGGGEGSRGGHVIGHLKSGKAVYESKGHTDARGLVSHVEEKHTGLTAAEHGEAAGMHRAAAAKAGKGSGEANYHEAHARAHELVGANKGLAEHFGGSVASGLSHGMDHSAGGLQTDYGRQRAAVGATPPEHAAQNASVAAEAGRASARLTKGGTPEEHTNAAGLHGAAANVAKGMGQTDREQHHREMAEAHTAIAKHGGGKINTDRDYATHPPGSHEGDGPRNVLPGGGLGANYSLSPTQKAEGRGLPGSGFQKVEQTPEAKKRDAALSAIDQAHSASDQVAAKGRSTSTTPAQGSDHIRAAQMHTRAAAASKAAGWDKNAEGHQQLAAAHEQAAKGNHAAAAEAFGHHSAGARGGHVYAELEKQHTKAYPGDGSTERLRAKRDQDAAAGRTTAGLDRDLKERSHIGDMVAFKKNLERGNPAREGIEAAKADDAERAKLRAAGKPIPPSLTGMHDKRVPPEQNPMSKVREKLSGKTPEKLNFADHKAAENEHKQAEEHAAAGNVRSAATHAGAAANMVTRGVASGVPSKRGHELAAALHEKAAKYHEQATKPQTAHVHKEMAAAHRLGAKAEATGKAAHHDRAFQAFDSTTSHPAIKQSVASLMSHHRAAAQRRS